MPDAQEVRFAGRGAALALEELSSSQEGPLRADLPGILRCCFRLLPCLDAGDKPLADRCRDHLFRFLHSVLSRKPSHSLVPAIEVFIENLVFSAPLRVSFAKRDTDAQVFTAVRQSNYTYTVLELVCNHFTSSLEGKGRFRAFLSALSWSGNDLQGAPEISLRGALSLINVTRSFSLSGVVRAHLFLLASRCVTGPNPRSHLPAFEHSMSLYMDCLPALGVFSRTGGVRTLARKRHFICCIKQVTHQDLESQARGLLSFCNAHLGGDMPISDSDIYDISDRLIEENQHLLHAEFRQEATLVLMSMLTNILNCAKQKEVHKPDAEMTEDIICIAAVLKLMGSLLPQIVNHFGQMRATDDNNNANHAELRRDYSIMCDTIRLLSQFEANELHRCDFIGIIGQAVDRQRASVQMLAHFASLSVFCARKRLGFLWRLCIIIMMMSINLVILEVGSLYIFQLLIDAPKESAYVKGNLSSALVPTTDNGSGSLKVYVRRSTKTIALRMTALRNRSSEKVNGQAFLRSLPGYKPSWNDLEDFFECEQDMDYVNYLEQREKFRAFVIEKSNRNNPRKRKIRDMLCGSASSDYWGHSLLEY